MSAAEGPEDDATLVSVSAGMGFNGGSLSSGLSSMMLRVLSSMAGRERSRGPLDWCRSDSTSRTCGLVQTSRGVFPESSGFRRSAPALVSARATVRPSTPVLRAATACSGVHPRASRECTAVRSSTMTSFTKSGLGRCRLQANTSGGTPASLVLRTSAGHSLSSCSAVEYRSKPSNLNRAHGAPRAKASSNTFMRRRMSPR
mmetsp:Transcript_39827/g.123088  ORF Transcript_39827/g.123088 Transcript_39827/m.123088 type:complete len:201 (-) Transcript_39827:341-943(-)